MQFLSGPSDSFINFFIFMYSVLDRNSMNSRWFCRLSGCSLQTFFGALVFSAARHVCTWHRSADIRSADLPKFARLSLDQISTSEHISCEPGQTAVPES